MPPLTADPSASGVGNIHTQNFENGGNTPNFDVWVSPTYTADQSGVELDHPYPAAAPAKAKARTPAPRW